MDLLSGHHKLLIVAFLVATMLSIGLTTGLAEMRALLAARGLVVRALLANLVIAPALGIAIARLLPIPHEAAWALVLLACVPGGLSAAQFTTKVAGEKSTAGAMLVLLSIAAIVVSPLVLRLALPPDVDLALPYGPVLGVFALLVVVPLVAGMLIYGRWPAAAPRLAKVIGLIGMLAFVGFSIAAKDARAEALKSMGGEGAVAMLLFVVACLAVGWLMGGRRREIRQMLATATSMRNTAFCLAIARNTGSGEVVMPALVAFSLLMVPPNALLTLYGTIRTRRSATRATESGQARAS